MRSKLDMEHFAAVVERYTTPLLEDSMSNEEKGYEMNTKHTPGPWVAHVEPGYSHYDVTAEVNRGPFVVDIIARLPRFRPQFNGPPDEQVANAVLIATAPRIATALEGLLIAVNDSLIKAEPKVIAAMQEARAALQEAAK